MQTKFAALGLIAAAGGGTWLVTGSGSGECYPMPPQEVASRLVSAHMPGEVGSSMSEAGDLGRRVYKRGDSEVVWEFSVARTPLATFTAALEPDGEGTRVAVDFEISDTDVGEAIALEIGEGRPFLTAILEIAMEEHIAATLEKRKFDDDAFGRELAKYALSNPGQARKYMQQMQQRSGASSETQATFREKIERDAQWHGDVERTDTRGAGADGFDPTPDDSEW